MTSSSIINTSFNGIYEGLEWVIKFLKNEVSPNIIYDINLFGSRKLNEKYVLI